MSLKLHHDWCNNWYIVLYGDDEFHFQLSSLYDIDVNKMLQLDYDDGMSEEEKASILKWIQTKKMPSTVSKLRKLLRDWDKAMVKEFTWNQSKIASFF